MSLQLNQIKPVMKLSISVIILGILIASCSENKVNKINITSYKYARLIDDAKGDTSNVYTLPEGNKVIFIE